MKINLYQNEYKKTEKAPDRIAHLLYHVAQTVPTTNKFRSALQIKGFVYKQYQTLQGITIQQIKKRMRVKWLRELEERICECRRICYIMTGSSTGYSKIEQQEICRTKDHEKKTPQKHLAKPLYPFQRIQVDHIQLPKVGKYEYVLVVVDIFSSWPEAYPVVNMTARVTAKRLITETVCRFGMPEVIESDQGPAFNLSDHHDSVVQFVIELSRELTKTHAAVFSSLPDPDTDLATHTLKPGEWVVVKKHVRKNCLEPRYEGPFQIILVTPTSVKLEGRTTWIHASHCRRVDPPELH
ncbi:uncharacterized protein ACNLHF_007333 [Anomaloglossus baeobatrachus]